MNHSYWRNCNIFHIDKWRYLFFWAPFSPISQGEIFVKSAFANWMVSILKRDTPEHKRIPSTHCTCVILMFSVIFSPDLLETNRWTLCSHTPPRTAGKLRFESRLWNLLLELLKIWGRWCDDVDFHGGMVYFHLYLGKWTNLTSIFLIWVESTNWRSLMCLLARSAAVRRISLKESGKPWEDSFWKLKVKRMSSYNWGRDTQLDSVLQCGVVESREVHQPHPKHHYDPTKSVPFWWTDNMSILVYDCVIKCDGHSKIRQKCGLLKAFQAFRSVGYFTLSQANSLDKNFKEGRNWSFGPSKKPLNHTALVLQMPWCWSGVPC